MYVENFELLRRIKFDYSLQWWCNFMVASAEWAKHLCSIMLKCVTAIGEGDWDQSLEAKPKAILLFSHLLGAVENKEPMETWHRFFDMVVVLLGHIRRERFELRIAHLSSTYSITYYWVPKLLSFFFISCYIQCTVSVAFCNWMREMSYWFRSGDGGVRFGTPLSCTCIYTLFFLGGGMFLFAVNVTVLPGWNEGSWEDHNAPCLYCAQANVQ